MKVFAKEPFEIIYSLYQHQYLGYLFESFVVQLDSRGLLTFQHQNISSKNAHEFAEALNEADYELIKLMDGIQQDAVTKKFSKKVIKPDDFFLKIYDKDKSNRQAGKSNKLIQDEIERFIGRRRSKILSLIKGKRLFEMGNDGEPTFKEIKVLDEKATILFHFRKNEENTHYFPTIKHCGVKVDFQYTGAYIICNDPAWMVIGCKLYHFEKEVDGNKLKPFLNKKFIVIPKSVEETYYNKFVAPLVASFDVYAKGFKINSQHLDPIAAVTFSELHHNSNSSLSLFENNNQIVQTEGKILFDLSYHYGDFKFKADHFSPISVTVEKNEDSYIFHRVNRRLDEEKEVIKKFNKSGLIFKNAKVTLPKSAAFDWLNRHKSKYEQEGVIFSQKMINGKKYFVGTPTIDIKVKEGIDWFDINAIIKFGDYDIPFKDLRKYILNKISEFKLPNGEYAVIPESWFVEYSEFFAFMSENGDQHTLKKHHLALVQELKLENLAKVTMSHKLDKLKDFEQIDDIPQPNTFKGELRPYQKAGYNWLHFLNQYNFGGCLADDMGLGKTVQTLAFLQSQKEQGHQESSLLIMPTSLVYNWEMEAKKFTPDLKVLVYTGTQRNKNIERFANYDIVITSYGLARIDVDLLQRHFFHYVILDESQAIKNPTSHTSKAVRQLKSRFRLILSGTPLENSTIDLWSQMSFINDGLLGSQAYFKNNFQIPIEKKSDEVKTKKLFTLIKPFILRRLKSQVATDLPEKVENVHYSIMSEDQQKEYDEVKEYYRSNILRHITKNGLGKSQMILLQGLTKLRQIANHPKMVDQEYQGDSGKMRDVFHMLDKAIQEGHKILVFSQFVKHLNLFQARLKEKGIDYAYLDGSTNNRQQQVDNFQNNPDLSLFLISLKAGGLGLNLTKADYVFILDPWWNPAIEAQAVDRAHRIGQENQVFTYRFITKNTIEEKIMALQQYKLKLATDLISTEESFMKKLSQEDIASILS